MRFGKSNLLVFMIWWLIANLICSPVFAAGFGSEEREQRRSSGSTQFPNPLTMPAPQPGLFEMPPQFGQEDLQSDIHRLPPGYGRVPGGRALSEVVQPDRYLLGPGDGLIVNIWGSFQAIYRVGVSADGKITLPKVGDVLVNGRTLAKTEADITAAVATYYRNVKTSVSLSRLRTFEVLVLGAVRAPGVYQATAVSHVSELLDQAGGVRPDGSQRHISVGLANEKEKRVIDLVAFKRKGQIDQNPVLQDGEMIFVPTMGSMIVTVKWTKIKVLDKGAITEEPTQAAVELEEGERMLDLLTSIGGIDFAWDLERVQIVRRQGPENFVTIPINMQKLFVEKDESQNIELKSGDLVVISPIIEKVFITGEVRSPGAYVYYPGKSIREYVGLAGGLTSRAEVPRSYVEHADGKRDSMDMNAKLSPGDSVVVSEVLFKWWQDYNTVTMSFLGIVISGIAALAASGALR
jgi:protein involved in polysaccharide export with SLBB domain